MQDLKCSSIENPSPSVDLSLSHSLFFLEIFLSSADFPQQANIKLGLGKNSHQISRWKANSESHFLPVAFNSEIINQNYPDRLSRVWNFTAIDRQEAEEFHMHSKAR